MRGPSPGVLEHRDGDLGLGNLSISFVLMLALCWPTAALAHVSERALVLLLPTEIYIRSGVIAVALTVALLFLLPPRFFGALFRQYSLGSSPNIRISTATSILSSMLLFFAIYAGFSGSRDPLANPMPLLIWTIWWIALPIASAFLGNVWCFLNPWTGLYRILGLSSQSSSPHRGIAVVLLVLFSVFVVADVAPDDPERLATIVMGYWVVVFTFMLFFGERWLHRCEPFTVYFSVLAQLSLIWQAERLKFGFFGARLSDKPVGLWVALVIIVALGAGSFDGLNETFWWLAQIGVNPLEFPGRSAVALPNALGLLAGILVLGLVFALCIWLGLWLVNARQFFAQIFPRLTLSLLPIALGYHIAHYLTTFMVGWQYALKTASDPLARGDDLFGLGTFYVTTSFFNVPSTVEAIWLTQATAIVVGHILAVLIAHAIALDILKSQRRATISQLPVAAFMVAYTFFGLWILAQPTGA